MQSLLKKNIEEIEAICKRRAVKKLYSFGSVNTENFNEDSDVDLLVDFKNIDVESYADNFFEMCYELEDLFGRKVDLVTIRSVKNPIFKKMVDAGKQLLFDSEKQLVD